MHIQIVQFLICTPAHLRTCAPAHVHTCTRAQLHACAVANLQTCRRCRPAHRHTCTLAFVPAFNYFCFYARCACLRHKFTCQNISHLVTSQHIVSIATMQTHVTNSSQKYTHIHSSFSFTSHYAILQQFRQKAAQHSTAQHSTAQHSTAQHSTAQHSTAQHSTARLIRSHRSTSHHTDVEHSLQGMFRMNHRTGSEADTETDTHEHNTWQGTSLRGSELSCWQNSSCGRQNPHPKPLNLRTTELLNTQWILFYGKLDGNLEALSKKVNLMSEILAHPVLRNNNWGNLTTSRLWQQSSVEFVEKSAQCWAREIKAQIKMDTLRRRSKDHTTVLAMDGKVQINEDARVFRSWFRSVRNSAITRWNASGSIASYTLLKTRMSIWVENRWNSTVGQ